MLKRDTYEQGVLIICLLTLLFVLIQVVKNVSEAFEAMLDRRYTFMRGMLNPGYGFGTYEVMDPIPGPGGAPAGGVGNNVGPASGACPNTDVAAPSPSPSPRSPGPSPSPRSPGPSPSPRSPGPSPSPRSPGPSPSHNSSGFFINGVNNGLGHNA
jgi:hypothetical protein